MSKLLINESPLQVQPSLAMAIGLNEAIFLQQLHYWLGASKYNREGRVWVYNTYAEWILQLRYMSERTLGRTIKSLKDQRLVIVEKFEQSKSNQVNYYTIDYDTLSIIEENISQVIDSIHAAKMSNSIQPKWHGGSSQNGMVEVDKVAESLQENTQEITQENSNKKTKQKSSKFSLEEACSVELPNGVDRSLWIAYIKMRHGMKKAPTQKAVELVLNDLTKMGGSAIANQSLENSIKNSWVGVFKPKEAVQSYSNARNDREAAWADYYRNREQQHGANLVDIQGVTHG